MNAPPPALHLYLVRHGESEANRHGILQGTTDWPLTARGRRQARRLGIFLAERGVKPDCVYVSHLERALDTARIVSRALGGPPLRIRRSLREVDFGRFEGTTHEERLRLYPDIMARVAEGHSLGEFDPSAEGFTQAQARARRFLGRMLARHADGGTVLAVSHAGFILNFVKAFMGVPPSHRLFFTLPNASYFHLEVAGSRRHVHAFCAVATP